MEISSSQLSAAGFALVITFIFSMFGQGGGSLYSPVLILLGYSVAFSTSTSLVLVFITSISAGYIFYREKRIDYKTSFIFDLSLVVITGIAVLVGSNLGVRVSRKINTAGLKAGLGLIMRAFDGQVLLKLV